MAQTNLTIRIDEDIKREAESLFNKIGMNMSVAINMFFRQALREQAIPFELKPYEDGCKSKSPERILHSSAQAEQEKTFAKTMDEPEAMGNE